MDSCNTVFLKIKIAPEMKKLLMFDFSPNSENFKILGCCPAWMVKPALRQPSKMAWHHKGPSCRSLYLLLKTEKQWDSHSS